jgi:hypothetical protein
MKKNLIISPVGLKGKEIHERQLALMGIKPITENENKGNYAVELTKVGPDGNAYAIVRENHEYYIKRSNKTTGLMLEDFKYIGGLQNKKDEAYPSYAKAIKQLNLKFKSLAEAYNKGGDINVFEDDNLLEHHPLKADMKLSATKGIGDNQEYVVDKSGTPLSNKAKEGKAEGQFGDNVAEKDVDDEFEKVKVNESGMHGFSEMRGNGFTGEGNLMGNKPMYSEDEELNEYEAAIEEMMARMEEEELDAVGHEDGDVNNDGKKDKQDAYLLNKREKIGKNIDEELHGDQHKLDVAEPKGKLTKADFDALNSMEESIKRLDALLEGELKKKVQTLTKRK